MRYKLTLQYDGSEFHGWQIQPDRRTVQGVLEEAILQMVGEPARVAAAGRTDAGVHATGQVVSFGLEKVWSTNDLQRGLNAITPADLAISTVETVGDDFDPRRSASGRRYLYRIWNARWQSPFWRRYAWHVGRPLDLAAMQQAAAPLLGEHDFTSFRAAACDAEHPVRIVRRSELARRDEMIQYEIEASAFLRHMVRNIVGTLVEVGIGARPADSIAGLLAARDRNLAAGTAPATGLCLVEVSYGKRSDRGTN